MGTEWLKIAKELAAISQTGLTYAKDPFDVERYEQIRRISAEIFANNTNLDSGSIVDIFRRESGYTTPKVDTRGAVFRDGKILMVKEISDGLWSLPGGWADVGISPCENVVREIWEESGFETVAKRLVAVIDRSKHGHKPPSAFHIYKMFFICEITGGEATTSNETSAVDFFGEDELPELSVTKILPEQIKMMFEYYRDEKKSAYFD